MFIYMFGWMLLEDLRCNISNFLLLQCFEIKTICKDFTFPTFVDFKRG